MLFILSFFALYKKVLHTPPRASYKEGYGAFLFLAAWDSLEYMYCSLLCSASSLLMNHLGCFQSSVPKIVLLPWAEIFS